MNVINTMIAIVVGYMVCWTPKQLFNITYTLLGFDIVKYDAYRYATSTFATLSYCINPFICIFMHKPVKSFARNVMNYLSKHRAKGRISVITVSEM